MQYYESSKKAFTKKVQKRIHNHFKGAKNAFELLRKGRLSEPYIAPYEVCHEDKIFKLRRYSFPKILKDRSLESVILLVPPLMVASEIYDISPELSAVSFLVKNDIDVWLIDFGAPEHVEGGLERTLDEHVIAIDIAIDKIRDITDMDIHLAGYSQGGMFAYQCAAYRKSKGLKSLITFGSPVDLHRNIPKVIDNLAEKLLATFDTLISKPLKYIPGLPAFLSSAGFKILSGTKEIKQMLGIFNVLHDRKALEKRERQRRFLGGEGFVAWPGPALKKFIEDIIVKNRMTSGGFIIQDMPVTLADIKCPILYFVGAKDTFGRPPSVRAINQVAVNADIHEVELNCGHFGLVVGTKSIIMTWSTVANWMSWLDTNAEKPDFNPEKWKSKDLYPSNTGSVESVYDLATDIIDGLWSRLGGASLEITSLIETMRWQLPRLAKVRHLNKNIRISISQTLTEQAQTMPDATFFLWKGKAFTYAQANDRVNSVRNALNTCGVTTGKYVGLIMDSHPDYLTLISAINRIGGISVLINTDSKGESLKHSLQAGSVEMIILDPANIDKSNEISQDIPIFMLGDYNKRLPANVASLDEFMGMHSDFAIKGSKTDPGRADDIAMILFASDTTGLPKAVKITNRRYISTALSAAAVASITPGDTVYCCIPLYHGTGLFIAVGGALMGGARLALASHFSVTTFWNDVRQYGVTVCCYVGEMCKYLINTPESHADKKHSLRLFAGNGLHKDVWKVLKYRFDIKRIIEFYASTEGNLVLINFSGKKIGSQGRPFDNPDRLKILKYDTFLNEIERDNNGRPVVCKDYETGLLISRIDDSHSLSQFDGYVDEEETKKTVIKDLFNKGDRWYKTCDLFWKDEGGDYWFVDRIIYGNGA